MPRNGDICGCLLWQVPSHLSLPRAGTSAVAFKPGYLHAVYNSFHFEIRRTQGDLLTFVLTLSSENDREILERQGFRRAKGWDQPT